MKKFLKIFSVSFALVSSLLLFSCGNGTSDTEQTVTDAQSEEPLSYEQITQEKAKELMETQTDYVIIDARTDEEFAQGHIEGAVLIPEYEIRQKAPQIIPDKDTLILVYCRSGRRSKIASEELVKSGYTNVKEFGGIIDWKYGTVK